MLGPNRHVHCLLLPQVGDRCSVTGIAALPTIRKVAGELLSPFEILVTQSKKESSMKNIALRRQDLWTSAFAVILIVLCCLIVQAQIPTGALAGTVTDQTGAVVSGATVVVKNEETGREFNTQTAGNGTFNVPALGTGTYTVTVTAQGFKTAVATRIKVAVGTPSSVNLELEVGQVSDTVTVTAVGGDLLQ